MDDALIRKNCLEFHKIGKFPKTVGAIDGTLIPIQGMSGDSEPAFVCRKGYHAINMQGVVDANMRFINICCRYPGSSHDSYILANSALYNIMENLPNVWLLGDSGYPLKDWLLTPFASPSNEKEVSYNKAHCKTRVVVERTFGILKSRFRCLHKTGGCLPFSPSKCSQIIETCCRLHNLAVDMRLPLVQEDFVIDDNNDIFQGVAAASAQQKRNEVAQRF